MAPNAWRSWLLPGLSCSVVTCLAIHCSSSVKHLLRVNFITLPPPLHYYHTVFALQVFYAMCQGLLYAFCYHLDTLLSKNHSEDAASAAQLQHVHISDAVLTPGLHTSPSCMQPAAIRQTLSQLLPCILHHRCCSAHHLLLVHCQLCTQWMPGSWHGFSPILSKRGTAQVCNRAILSAKLVTIGCQRT